MKTGVSLVAVFSVLLNLVLPVVAAAQSADPTQVGFVVVTTVSGNPAGLLVFERLLEGGQSIQTQIAATPLLTSAALVVDLNPATASNTGISIVNPGDGPATLTFRLRNSAGTIVADRTLVLVARQQTAQFVNEIFGIDLATTLTGLMTVSSDRVIGIAALDFRGQGIALLPVTSLTAVQTTIIVPAEPSSSFVSRGPSGVITLVPTLGTVPIGGIMGTVPVTVNRSVLDPIVPLPTNPIVSGGTFVGINVPLTLTPTLLTPVAPVLVVDPFTGLGVRNVLRPVVGSVLTPPTSLAFQTRAPLTTAEITTFAPGIGGSNAFLVPLFAQGGGFASEIVIANTSSTTQIVRVDFFDPTGNVINGRVRSAIDLAVPAGGVIVIPAI